MTYAVSAALQAAIYEALATDPVLDGMTGGAIHDAEPEGAGDLYVALGPEDVRQHGDATGLGAVHRLRIGVVTTRDGFAAAKEVAGQVSTILERPGLILGAGRLVSLTFQSARARRDRSAGTRRIDMVFRARTEI
ncbi:DUF3168 domain-containing protein [Jannaschia aquimarina]|uniref:Gene transfer agent protein n=1 Tax=Jannaschia aquimarina TaxID=935700 RepID=A0A0D1ENR5_9RHOB|nr:DUF3168 domain-containing protein [Jannaschia aquimarina]KIT17290.1 hypothetical protein jaqu_10210 [Jannaschia aquimarina]SNT19736.1 Protein of unknown function [Jannaschia aquimarina]